MSRLQIDLISDLKRINYTVYRYLILEVAGRAGAEPLRSDVLATQRETAA